MRLYFLAAGFFYGLGGILLLAFPEHLQITHSGIYASMFNRTAMGFLDILVGCLQFLSLRYGYRRLFALTTTTATLIAAIFIALIVTYTSLFQQNNWGISLNWWFIVAIHAIILTHRLERSSMRRVIRVLQGHE